MNASAFVWSLCLWFFVIANVSIAAPVPTLNVSALVDEADVVALGTVTAITDVGPSFVNGPNGSVQARAVSGDLLVDQILKGATELASIEFQFTVPDVFIGYRSVEAGGDRIFFLKRRGDRYELVSPYYPSVVGTSGVQVSAGRVVDRVFEAVAAVLRSDDTSANQKREAIQILWDVKSPVSLASLRVALQQNDLTVGLSAAAALLAADDLSALPIAESALLQPTLDFQSELLHNLRVGISQGLRNPTAIPALVKLLAASEPETRRAASYALGHMHSPSALQPLLRALDDVDVEVKHNAVVGLGEITGQVDWGPSMPAFLADQERYIGHWKDWSRNR